MKLKLESPKIDLESEQYHVHEFPRVTSLGLAYLLAVFKRVVSVRSFLGLMPQLLSILHSPR